MPDSAAVGQILRFRDRLGLRLGLRFGDDRLSLLRELLLRRARFHRCSPQHYLDRHLEVGQELNVLARALSVNETYFLRDSAQFDALRSIFRELERAGRSNVSVLSAGCASGEEAYSVAIIAAEVVANLDRLNLSITGIDLDSDVLDRARKAQYTRWSLRDMPPELASRHFTLKRQRYQLAPSLKSMVRFEQRNLVEPDPAFWSAGAFDVIFCRNVLMYFTPGAMEDVVSRLTHALKPGGYLFLGHAEHLRGLNQPLELLSLKTSFGYRRSTSRGRAANDAQSLALERQLADFDSSNTSGIVVPRSMRSATFRQQPAQAGPNPVSARPAEVINRAKRAADAEPRQRSGRPAEALRQLMALVEANRITDALLISDELLARDGLNADAHHARGLCLEHRGDERQAAEEYQLAAYVDPHFAMPHLNLGLLARRGCEPQRASRELGLAARLLPTESELRISLFGGGFDRAAMIQLCAAPEHPVTEVAK